MGSSTHFHESIRVKVAVWKEAFALLRGPWHVLKYSNKVISAINF